MSEVTALKVVIYLAIEMSQRRWRLVFCNGQRYREVGIPAGALGALKTALEEAKRRLGMGASEVELISCYEAGRDGFWLHRWLTKQGVKNRVIDPASVEVDRRRRRAKTDRLDGRLLVRKLMEYEGYGQRSGFRVVRVPTEEAEAHRRREREMEQLIREKTAHANRIRSLLALYGIRVGRMEVLDMEQLPRDWEGKALPVEVQEEVRREWQRWRLVEEQRRELEEQEKREREGTESEGAVKVRKLMKLRAVGARTAEVLVRELWGWRRFENRRQVGAIAGLVGSPYASGDRGWEQGISKAGNRRVRRIMVELSWRWVRYQGGSEVTKWYRRRFGGGGRRMRRVGIVAVARKLLIALWRYVEADVVPAGAVMSVS